MMWDREEKARHRRMQAADEERRAAAAKALLENPALMEAMARLEQDYIQSWQLAETTAAREDIWHRLQGLKALQSDLGAAASGGAIAAHNTRSLAD